jgi:hypothetical protein
MPQTCISLNDDVHGRCFVNEFGLRFSEKATLLQRIVGGN